MADNNGASHNNDKSGLVLIVIGFILVSVSLYFYLSDAPNKGLVPSSKAVAAPLVGETPAAPIASDEEVAFSLDVAMSPRTLGEDDAPVKVTEFASLSCGHCGKFHKETLPKLIKSYVDTGKVQLIFADFPLNEPALDGSMLARCLPKNQYVPFTDLLFKEQEQWAYETGHKDKLIAYAETFGLSKGKAKDCLANNELRNALIASVQANAKQWQVNSTPSFLINNKTVIKGNKGYAAFAQELDTFLTE